MHTEIAHLYEIKLPTIFDQPSKRLQSATNIQEIRAVETQTIYKEFV